MNPATNRLRGPVVELHRLGDLLEDAGAHHRHPVAQGHRLGLVVGHVHGGRAQAALDARHLGAHLDAQLGVEVRQRLVHEERRRVAHDGAAHGHALALATRQVRGLAVEVLLEVEDARGLLDLLVDLLLGHLGELEREAHVVAHRHVRVQRVVLEDHRDVAVLRRLLVDHLAADQQLAVGDVLEAGDHPQGGRLPAARRADEDDELAVVDLEIHVLDGLVAVGIALRDVVEDDVGHLGSPYPLTAPAVRPATMRRWKMSTRMMIGTVTTIEAAEIAPIGCSNCEPPGEERQRGGHGARVVGRGERVGEDEVVPGENEDEDRRREHSGRGERHDHLAEGLERASPRPPGPPARAPRGSRGRTPKACRWPAAA